jgi:hypothetical protein
MFHGNTSLVRVKTKRVVFHLLNIKSYFKKIRAIDLQM